MLSAAKLFETAQNQLDHNRLFALINSLNDGFLAVDEDGVIRLSNGVALNLLDSNTIEGKSIAQVMPVVGKAGQVVDLLKLIKSSGGSLTSREYSLKLAGGETVNLYISIAPVRGGFGKTAHEQSGYVIILRDITKEKSKEDERDEFIGVVSHELSTPVAVAEGGISNALLLADRSHLPESIIQSLKSAHEQMIFLMSLINDLALLSRTDGNRSALSVEEINIEQLITDLQKDYQPQADKKKLELNLKVEPIESKFFSNHLYVREILQNLITNAIKYTETGKIEVVVSGDQAHTNFRITDTGIGIDKVDQTKLFTKFFRSEDYRVRKISGTGLGLYVSSKLVRMLGGQITVVSELNRGSNFTLSLPNSVYHPAKPTTPPVA